MSPRPKVSVITVNFNMGDEVAATLDSVLRQDYPSMETIVIDGGSTDGSREIIAAYGPRLSYWVSECDRNLYDGMNKGVAAATGEWILFMNSGDLFSASDVLSRVFSVAQDDADILYGHHTRRYADACVDRLIRAERPDVLPLRMHCSHQAMLMRRDILVQRPFALDLLAADYDAILAAYVEKKRFRLTDIMIAIIVQGGRSDTQRLRMLRERVILVRRHGLMTPAIARYYIWLRVRAVLGQAMKKVLPKNVVTAILRRRPIEGMG